jgi:hypothetical protein
MIGEIGVLEMLRGERNGSGTRGGSRFGSRSRSRGGLLGVDEVQRVLCEVRNDSSFTKHFLECAVDGQRRESVVELETTTVNEILVVNNVEEKDEGESKLREWLGDASWRKK